MPNLLSGEGCYLSLNTPEGTRKAQEQLDKLPGFLERRKVGGKHLPIEVYIRKKSGVLTLLDPGPS